MHKSYVTIRSSVFFLIAGLIPPAAGGAHAQEVVNPSFELPVAGPPTYYILDPPTTAGVGWSFSGPAPNVSGVQQNGAAKALQDQQDSDVAAQNAQIDKEYEELTSH
jgi:hypothetical protein